MRKKPSPKIAGVKQFVRDFFYNQMCSDQFSLEEQRNMFWNCLTRLMLRSEDIQQWAATLYGNINHFDRNASELFKDLPIPTYDWTQQVKKARLIEMVGDENDDVGMLQNIIDRPQVVLQASEISSDVLNNNVLVALLEFGRLEELDVPSLTVFLQSILADDVDTQNAIKLLINYGFPINSEKFYSAVTEILAESKNPKLLVMLKTLIENGFSIINFKTGIMLLMSLDWNDGDIDIFNMLLRQTLRLDFVPNESHPLLQSPTDNGSYPIDQIYEFFMINNVARLFCHNRQEIAQQVQSLKIRYGLYLRDPEARINILTFFSEIYKTPIAPKAPQFSHGAYQACR